MKIFEIDSRYSSEYGIIDERIIYVEAKDEAEARQIHENHFPEDDGYCGGYWIEDIKESDRPSDLHEGVNFFTATTPFSGECP